MPITPWLLFPITLVIAYLAFSPGSSERTPTLDLRAGKRNRTLLDTAVSTLLTFALPSLLASSAALIVYRLRPERVGEILERLPFDSLVRLILLFAPPTLLSIVILAVLFLRGSRRERVAEKSGEHAEIPRDLQTPWRASLATGVLVAGLSLSAFLGLGAFGSAALYPLSVSV